MFKIKKSLGDQLCLNLCLFFTLSTNCLYKILIIQVSFLSHLNVKTELYVLYIALFYFRKHFHSVLPAASSSVKREYSLWNDKVLAKIKYN